MSQCVEAAEKTGMFESKDSYDICAMFPLGSEQRQRIVEHWEKFVVESAFPAISGSYASAARAHARDIYHEYQLEYPDPLNSDEDFQGLFRGYVYVVTHPGYHY